MRRIRQPLAPVVCLALVVSVLSVASPAAANDNGKNGLVKEQAVQSLPDPQDVVTNEVEVVQPGTDPSSGGGESLCDWFLAVPDDLLITVKNAGVGFRTLNGQGSQARALLNGFGRAYSETGRWWSRSCPSENGAPGTYDLIPEGEAVTVEELVLRSIGVLDPSEPVFQINPDGKQLTQFETLFWVEPAYWDLSRVDTQTAGRVVSTVELVPTFSVWDPGDGSRPVECEGPGEIWVEGKDDADFDCKYTYWTVAGEPFTLSATVQFDIEVTATIGGTPVPDTLGPYEFLERTATFEVGVREIQGLETNPY